MVTTAHELVALGDSGQMLADPDADIRGRDITSADGQDLGRVDDLLIDASEGKVRFMVVASGGFLGLGEDRSFIPVDAISEIADDRVRLAKSRDEVSGAPTYDPALINEPSYTEGVFGYYGYAPFWSAGYVYPAFPARW